MSGFIFIPVSEKQLKKDTPQLWFIAQTWLTLSLAWIALTFIYCVMLSLSKPLNLFEFMTGFFFLIVYTVMPVGIITLLIAYISSTAKFSRPKRK